MRLRAEFWRSVVSNAWLWLRGVSGNYGTLALVLALGGTSIVGLLAHTPLPLEAPRLLLWIGAGGLGLTALSEGAYATWRDAKAAHVAASAHFVSDIFEEAQRSAHSLPEGRDLSLRADVTQSTGEQVTVELRLVTPPGPPPPPGQLTLGEGDEE